MAAAEAGVAAQQLPAVDVADRHELGEPPAPLDAHATLEGGREDPGTPFAVKEPAAVRDLAQPGDTLLLGEQPQHAVAHRLVVVDQHAHGPGDIVDRRLVALAANPLRLALGGRREQPVPAAEATDHRLHGHSGPPCHLVQRDLLAWQLPEHLDRRVEDALSRRGGGLRAGDHAVWAARSESKFSR